MIFTKEWFSIDESIEILNKSMQGKIELTQKYIKDLFLEGNIELYIKTRLISSSEIALFSEKMCQTPFFLVDENGDKIIDKYSFDITGNELDVNLHIEENGEFWGSGYLQIISDNCLIAEKPNTFSILTNSFGIFIPENKAIIENRKGTFYNDESILIYVQIIIFK